MCSSHSTRHSARTVAESATNRDLRLALVRVTLGNLKRKIKTEHSLRSQTDLIGCHNIRAVGTEDIPGGYLQYMAATYFCVKEVAARDFLNRMDYGKLSSQVIGLQNYIISADFICKTIIIKDPIKKQLFAYLSN